MYEELIRRLREEPLDSNKATLPIMDLCTMRPPPSKACLIS